MTTFEKENHKLLNDEKTESQIGNMSDSDQAFNIPTSTDSNIKEKVDIQIIKKFTMTNFILSLSFVLVSLFIEIIIASYFDEYDFKAFDSKVWWVISFPVIVFLSIVLYTYFNQDNLLKEDTYLAYILFPFFILSIYLMIVILSFKYIKVCLSISILLSMGILILIIFDSLVKCYDKTLIKLMTVYAYCFLHLILHLIYVKSYFVEFFVLIVFAFLYFAYINSQMKFIIISFIKEKWVDKEEPITLRSVFTTLMIIPIDMMGSNFK
jgi:hypothetical protein